MELGLVKTLKKQIKDTYEKPDIQAKLQEHLEETERHAEKVEECITRLGGDPSAGKDWMAQAGAVVQGVAASMPQDALIKNLHASYAAEHFEIAAYTLIAAAAEELEDTETATVCREILADEEDMQSWLLDTIPRATMEFLEEEVAV
jgi:ferritin-like metal-binding protein YciE